PGGIYATAQAGLPAMAADRNESRAEMSCVALPLHEMVVMDCPGKKFASNFVACPPRPARAEVGLSAMTAIPIRGLVNIDAIRRHVSVDTRRHIRDVCVGQGSPNEGSRHLIGCTSYKRGASVMAAENRYRGIIQSDGIDGPRS